MRAVLTAVLVCAAATIGAIGRTSAQPGTDAKSQLETLLNELNAALARRDRAALERIYADDFQFVHATSGVVDKGSHIATIMATEAPAGREVRPSFDDVVVNGDTAILRSRNRGMQSTTVYVRRGGSWRILQVQSTLLPAERTPVSIDPKLLDAYVGTYEFGPGAVSTVTREGDALLWQPGSRAKFRLLPLAADRFFGQATSSEMTFRRNAQGAVEGVDLRLGTCQDSQGRKVK